MRRILLAHMGDAETASAIPALADRYAAAVVTLTVDVGQDGTPAVWRERALSAGAVRAHVVDARESLLREFLLPALHAGALRGGLVEDGGAMLRVVMAEHLLDVAAMEGASFLAHGFPSGSDAARHFEATVRQRQPECLILPAPDSAAALAGERPRSGTPPRRPSDTERIVGVESSTIWRRVVVRADRRDVSLAALPGIRPGLFSVVPPERCPASPAQLVVTFREGLPVALNGIEMPLVELVEAVDTIAGDHGVGRTVAATREATGWRIAAVESPAVLVLSVAYHSLGDSVAGATLRRIHRYLGRQYQQLLRSGQWLSDAREALDVFADGTRRRVTGTVSLRLHRGRCRVMGGSIGLAGHAGDRVASPASTFAVSGAAPAADASLTH